MTRTRTILLLGLLAMPASAWAQARLPDLSLEDLMKLDAGQVFGASERLQPAIEAPASVSFITAEEIARYGYRTLAEILRGVRGLYVSNDRNFSLIGIRGFSKPGDYNSRILLLINGHRVNDNVFGQAEIGAEFGLDPATFERVEIIRGPASSLYGDSAFFAVVNVITRTGASLGGASVTVEAGTLGSSLVRAAVGRRFPNGVDLALSGTFAHSRGVTRLYYPAFDDPSTNNGVAEGLDGEGVRQFYGRLAVGGFTVTGAYGARQRDVPTASFGTLFNQQDSREETTDRHTLVDALYGRSFGETRVTFRVSFDRFTYDGAYPFMGETDAAPLNLGRDSAVGERWTFGSGVTHAFGRQHTVRAGVELIDNVRQDQTGSFETPPSKPLDSHRSSIQHAIYAQDEFKLTRWFIVNVGLRYDGYEEFVRFSPRAALIILPSSKESFKYLYGNAFRAPSTFELNTVFYGPRVQDLRPESIDTHEIVWERYLSDRLRTSVSTYWYKADGLVTLVSDDTTLLGATFVNQDQVRAKGLELEAQVRLKADSQLLVSYALQRAEDQATGLELPNSPRHVAKARISLPGPTRGSFVSVAARYLSRRQLIDRSEDGAPIETQWVGAASDVSVTMVQPLGKAWELTGSVNNLFGVRFSDPASSGHRQDSIEQNGRTAVIGLRFKLWPK